MSFWGELKRRNVFKVGVAYIIAAWLIVQVANTFFPILHLPEWTVTFIAALLILGLPVALILAWAYEMTPEGVKLTKKVPLADSITHVTGRKLNYVLGALLVIAVALLIFDNYYLDRPKVVETETASVVHKEVPAATEVKESETTIAVLPFSDLSPDKDQGYFVDGLSEELLNCLANIHGLRVTSRTSSFAFKDTDKTLQEVASVLDVDHILEGSVRKSGDSLRITAQLIRVKDDSHLWSESYNRELKDIFTLQEDIATTVADKLKLTLGIGSPLKQLGGTDNVEAYELYLVAKGLREKMQTGDGGEEDFLRIFELLDSALALDPEFALAWVLKSERNFLAAIWGPANQAAEFKDAALSSAFRAVELEPDMAAGFYQLGFIKAGRSDFIGAKEAYLHAQNLETEQSPNSHTGDLYLSVGKFEKAKESYGDILRNDPLNPDVRHLYMVSFACLNDTAGAEREYEHGRALFGDQWFGNLMISPIRLGTGDSISSDDIPMYSLSGPIPNTAREYLASPKEGLEELHRIYDEEENISIGNLGVIAIWSAYFGDPELAINVMEKVFEKDVAGLYHIWLPVMHEVRQLPRFKELLKEIGLVDYWEKFGWPDICHKLDNGDFECD